MRRVKKLASCCVLGLRAGQVIPDVVSCVKELVDNALDAKATEIDIQLVEDGLRLIQVADNGKGMNEEELRQAGLPNATSKIQSFADVDSHRSTLGFRGEALNALAYVSQLTIISRCEEMDCGKRVSYTAEGVVCDDSVCDECREVGTTVMAEHLFSRLPVRAMELRRSAKTQVESVIHFLTAYSLMHRHVEFRVVEAQNLLLISVPKKIFQASHASDASLLDCFKTMFGSALAASMMSLDVVDPQEPSLWRYGEQNGVQVSMLWFRLTGLLSSPREVGGGKSKRARFTFVNGYWVVSGLGKLIQAITALYQELYGKRVSLQYLLNLELQDAYTDFNVASNKLWVVVEKLPTITRHVLEALRSQLSSSWWCTAGVPVQRSGASLPVSSQPLDAFVLSPQRFVEPSQEKACEGSDTGGRPFSQDTPSSRTYSPPLSLRSSPHHTTGPNVFAPDLSRTNSVEKQTPQSFTPTQDASRSSSGVSHETGPDADHLSQQEALAHTSSPLTQFCSADTPGTNPREAQSTADQTHPGEKHFYDSYAALRRPGTLTVACWPCGEWQRLEALELKEESHVALQREDVEQLSLDRGDISSVNLKFPKEAFQQMQVIGQFNKGFILGSLPCLNASGTRTMEVFVVDQHAADEKYRYEQLCSKTCVNTLQSLMTPVPLQLSPTEKQIVLNHLNVFRWNGFRFHDPQDMGSSVEASQFKEQQEKQHQTSRDALYLSAVPHYGSVTLGCEDVLDIINLLKTHATPWGSSEDQILSALRPQKLKSFFASRACRSAVMIGTELNRTQMTCILRQLAKLCSPWTCPHGRPTLRHLCCLA